MTGYQFAYEDGLETVAACWRERGFAVVSGLIPEDLVQALAELAADRFPAAGSLQAQQIRDFGSNLTFPSRHGALNEITLHPRLLKVCSKLLGVPIRSLRLTQSDLWAKYGNPPSVGDYDNADQRIHVDYPNHTLVHPSPWHRPDAVELIVYLSDSNGVDGGTAVVPRLGEDDPLYSYPITANPGVGELRWINNRSNAEQYLTTQHPEIAAFREGLYAREQILPYRAGDVLLYRHDTWHRGTPLQPGTSRFALNATFRRADAEWICTLHKGWSWSAYHPEQFLERLIASASVDQRTVLGFPAPGSTYWCEETLAAVEARYGVFGIDMGPYAANVQG